MCLSLVTASFALTMQGETMLTGEGRRDGEIEVRSVCGEYPFVGRRWEYGCQTSGKPGRPSDLGSREAG